MTRRPLTPAELELYALAMSSLQRPAEPASVLPGVELAPAVCEAVNSELARRERRRGSEPVGGLVDETARAQADLFD